MAQKQKSIRMPETPSSALRSAELPDARIGLLGVTRRIERLSEEVRAAGRVLVDSETRDAYDAAHAEVERLVAAVAPWKCLRHHLILGGARPLFDRHTVAVWDAVKVKGSWFTVVETTEGDLSVDDGGVWYRDDGSIVACRPWIVSWYDVERHVSHADGAPQAA